ncbi:hypothetical protein BaRGS_00026463, partial [Batillaria attramentaria]
MTMACGYSRRLETFDKKKNEEGSTEESRLQLLQEAAYRGECLTLGSRTHTVAARISEPRSKTRLLLGQLNDQTQLLAEREDVVTVKATCCCVLEWSSSLCPSTIYRLRNSSHRVLHGSFDAHQVVLIGITVGKNAKQADVLNGRYSQQNLIKRNVVSAVEVYCLIFQLSFTSVTLYLSVQAPVTGTPKYRCSTSKTLMFLCPSVLHTEPDTFVGAATCRSSFEARH